MCGEESTVMNNTVKIEELLKVEEEKGVYGGQWADSVRKVMKYRDDNGHCNVPKRLSSLGMWVSYQRREFRKFDAGKASTMTPQRIKILNYIGFMRVALDKIVRNRNDVGCWRS
mmetsp:Transcript_4447/g.6805  ORF Transcript_4447/g.6805 Transcript_4447/m.6805 type:complete len:114 (-) Transcript_4447:417-758(-)